MKRVVRLRTGKGDKECVFPHGYAHVVVRLITNQSFLGSEETDPAYGIGDARRRAVIGDWFPRSFRFPALPSLLHLHHHQDGPDTHRCKYAARYRSIGT